MGTKAAMLALIAPLVFASGCSTSSGLGDNIGTQQMTAPSFAGGSGMAVAPDVADDAADGDSGGTSVQVAALAPGNPSRARNQPSLWSVLPGRKARYSARDRECLARAMFFESNRSSRDGLVAVGSVVMNRVDSGKWGDSVCDVVGAKRQFAPGVLSRPMNSAALPDVMAAADAVLQGERHPKVYPAVMHFHTAGHRFPYDNMHYVTVAGGNSFYEKRRRMRGMRNTSQSAVMAAARSPASKLMQPVKAVLNAPVDAVRATFSSEEPTPVRKVIIRRKVARTQFAPDLAVENEAPLPAEAVSVQAEALPTVAPVPAASPVDAAPVEAASVEAAPIVAAPAPSGKSGRVRKKIVRPDPVSK